jgi:hypothetical protein
VPAEVSRRAEGKSYILEAQKKKRGRASALGPRLTSLAHNCTNKNSRPGTGIHAYSSYSIDTSNQLVWT